MWRTSRIGRWSLAVFGLGACCGALCTLTGLWLLSGLFAPLHLVVRAVMLLIIAAAAVARDLELVHIDLPQAARQIPRTVLQAGPLRGAFQFGFELGTGVRTYITGSAPYVAAAAVLLLAPPLPLVAVAAAGVAIGRTLPLLQALGDERPRVLLDMSAAHRSLAAATATLTLACVSAITLLVAVR